MHHGVLIACDVIFQPRAHTYASLLEGVHAGDLRNKMLDSSSGTAMMGLVDAIPCRKTVCEDEPYKSFHTFADS